MAVDREFQILEEAIRRTGREYDIFLHGTGDPRPVTESRKHIEKMIRDLSNRRDLSPADRYRLNTLMSRYASECERWDRQVRQREEGTERHMRITAAAPAVPPAPRSPNASAPPSVHSPKGKSPDERLFARYLEEKKTRGEDVTALSFAKFEALLARERQRLAEKTGKAEWDFDVSADDARVRLVARPTGKKRSA